MNKAPFWYVVKSRFGGYLSHRDKHVERQRHARPLLTRTKAKEWAAEWPKGSHKVVRVWARPPKPRIPDWMRPTTLRDGLFAVFRIDGRRVWEYLFEVADSGSFFPFDTIAHDDSGTKPYGPARSFRPEVAMEAAMRAGRIVRARKRGARKAAA